MTYFNRIKHEAPDGPNQFYFRLVRYALLGLGFFMFLMGIVILFQNTFELGLTDDLFKVTPGTMALIFLLHGAIILLPFKGSPAYRTWLVILLLPGTMLLLFMGITGMMTPIEEGGSVSTGVMILIPAITVIGYFYLIGQPEKSA